MIEWTRVRLASWGRWCRGGIGTGLPKASAFVHANEGGRGADGGDYMPPDVEQIERIVNRMSASLRQPLVLVYVTKGPLWFKAMQIGMTKKRLRQLLTTAEAWVTKELARDSAT